MRVSLQLEIANAILDATHVDRNQPEDPTILRHHQRPPTHQ